LEIKRFQPSNSNYAFDRIADFRGDVVVAHGLAIETGFLKRDGIVLGWFMDECGSRRRRAMPREARSTVFPSLC
jgi:hypothetical protein